MANRSEDTVDEIIRTYFIIKFYNHSDEIHDYIKFLIWYEHRKYANQAPSFEYYKTAILKLYAKIPHVYMGDLRFCSKM